MLPSLSRLNTKIGMLLSMHREKAVASATFRPRQQARQLAGVGSGRLQLCGRHALAPRLAPRQVLAVQRVYPRECVRDAVRKVLERGLSFGVWVELDNIVGAAEESRKLLNVPSPPPIHLRRRQQPLGEHPDAQPARRGSRPAEHLELVRHLSLIHI